MQAPTSKTCPLTLFPCNIPAFCATGKLMEYLAGLLLSFAGGYFLARWQNKRWRHDRLAALQRKYQLIAAVIENKGLRHNKKRPSLTPWYKWLLGLFYQISPRLTAYTLFRPETLIGWHRKYFCSYWWLISKTEKSRLPGRPSIPDAIVQIVLDISEENPSYGAERIARIINKQLDTPISESTVRNILNGQQPKKKPTKPGEQSWKTFLKNHREILASMDFKVTHTLRLRPLFILSVLSHDKRRLIHCRATYNPTSAWVAQQMREAFPFDEAPQKMIMDHDSIFLPVVKNTLPAMGIGVIRTAIKCPWQNGTIERFNKTLKDELLNHIIPIDDVHLNRLLAEFKEFYNTARPHQANKGLAPEQCEASNEAYPITDASKITSVEWLAGLHHSYRRAA